MKFARQASRNEHTSTISPQAVGSGVTLSTISEYELGLSLASESSSLPGTGATLSLSHTSANMTNRLTFQIGEMRTNVEFVAQIYELRQADTVLLADALIDRPDDYELSFKPKGTGTIVLNILYSKYNGIGDPLTSASINLNDFETSIIRYETQEVTSTICSGGEDKYRFGFNGQEKDNEIKGLGNSLNYQARMQDTRLGRFLSIDPLTKSFPWYSPYQFAGNTPIVAIDLDGLEEYVVHNFRNKEGFITKIGIITAEDKHGKLLNQNRMRNGVNQKDKHVLIIDHNYDGTTRPDKSARKLNRIQSIVMKSQNILRKGTESKTLKPEIEDGIKVTDGGSVIYNEAEITATKFTMGAQRKMTDKFKKDMARGLNKGRGGPSLNGLIDEFRYQGEHGNEIKEQIDPLLTDEAKSREIPAEVKAPAKDDAIHTVEYDTKK